MYTKVQPNMPGPTTLEVPTSASRGHLGDLDEYAVLDAFQSLPKEQLGHFLRTSVLEYVVSPTEAHRVGVVMEHCESDLGRITLADHELGPFWIHTLLSSLADDSAVIFRYTGLIQADLKLQNVFYTADPASVPERQGYFLIGDLGGFCPQGEPLRSRATYRRKGIEENGVAHLSFQLGFLLLFLLLRNAPREEDLRRQRVNNRTRPRTILPSFIEWVNANTERLQQGQGFDVGGMWSPRRSASEGMGWGPAAKENHRNALPSPELAEWFNEEYGLPGEPFGGLRNYLFHNLQVEFFQDVPSKIRAKARAQHYVDYVEALMVTPYTDMQRLVDKTKEMMRIYMEVVSKIN